MVCREHVLLGSVPSTTHRSLPRRRESVYVTDVAMLVIQYAQIDLPCLFAVALAFAFACPV